jgi:NAD+ kinase
MEPFTLASEAGAAPIGVLVTPTGDCEPQVATIAAWAGEHGVEVEELGTSAEPTGRETRSRLLIALGGDGTILRALQLAMSARAAVLGVNFGTVGFLADVHRDDLGAALERIARGEAQIEERTALAATIRTAQPHPMVAFNDVVIARRPGFGTARLRVEVGGEPMLELTGDGIVIASPMGSTAYTVGAGGPAVSPTLDAIVITPLATQGSPLRSLVVDGSDTVRVVVMPMSAPLSVEIDGRTTEEMPTAAALEVRAAPRKARLMRTRPRSFYHDLSNRL